MDTKDLLLVESNQFQEELIDDSEPVNDQQIENEIELSHCIIQTEEVMQITVNKEDEPLESTTSQHQCSICGKELLSAYTLANHMRSHTGERPYGCSVCEKFFKTKSNLNEHYRVHNPELRWMKTSSRDIPSITRVTVTSEDILTCGQCSKVFISLDELSAHELTHATDDEQLKEEEHQEPELEEQQLQLQQQQQLQVLQQQTVARTTTYTCEQCNKNYTSKLELVAHIRNNCLDPVPIERHCPFCGKQFRSMATLENHKRVHTREKPFLCDVCTKPFRTKGNLLEHKRVHNSSLWLMKSNTKLQTTAEATAVAQFSDREVDQRFKCSYCPKPFRTYTALLNHERVHTREKPFECSECGKCFRTKSNMTEHMKGCHDIDYSANNPNRGLDEVQVFTFKTQLTISSNNLETAT